MGGGEERERGGGCKSGKGEGARRSETRATGEEGTRGEVGGMDTAVRVKLTTKFTPSTKIPRGKY